jgi:hypothetical protein
MAKKMIEVYQHDSNKANRESSRAYNTCFDIRPAIIRFRKPSGPVLKL